MNGSKALEQEIATEVLNRLQATDSIYHYAWGTFGSGFIEGKHLQRISDALERIYDGTLERLAMALPGRSGKSMMITSAIAWILGKNPRARVMVLTGGENLAESISMGVEAKLNTPFHKHVFGEPRFDRRMHTRTRWMLEGAIESRPTMIATTVRGQVYGEGADYIFIDDPLNSALQADSAKERDNVWRLIESFETRLQPGAKMVLIQTPRHYDDPLGRIERKQEAFGGDTDWRDWEVIKCPAINPDGTALWAEFGWTLTELKKIEKTLCAEGSGRRLWNTEYLMRPTPESGEVFLREYWKYYDHAKAHMITGKTYMSVDTASTEAEEADYSVLNVIRNAPNGHYDLDMFRKQVEYPDLKRAVYSMCEKWNPICLIENKHVGIALIQDMKKETKYKVIPIQPEANKYARAKACTDDIEGGRFFLPKRDGHVLYWAQDLIEEGVQFPKGVHDDMIDTISMYLNYVNRTGTHIQKRARSFDDI